VNPHIFAREWLAKNVTAAKNARNSRRIVGRVLYAGHVVSKESRRFFLELLVNVTLWRWKLSMVKR
jgi:hypothetical protein